MRSSVAIVMARNGQVSAIMNSCGCCSHVCTRPSRASRMPETRFRIRSLIDSGLCLLGERGKISASFCSSENGEWRVSGIVKEMATVISMSARAKYDGSQTFRCNRNPEVAGPTMRVSWPMAPRRKNKFDLIADVGQSRTFQKHRSKSMKSS